MYFASYGLRKPWLDKCLKKPVSEDLLKSNMVVGAKHCWNVNHRTFGMFIDQWEGNWVGKSLS